VAVVELDIFTKILTDDQIQYIPLSSWSFILYLIQDAIYQKNIV